MTTDKTIELFHDLVRINMDSARGYELTAPTIKHRAIAALFRRIARDRRHQVAELLEMVEMSDDQVHEREGAHRFAHRWWVLTRGALSGGDDFVALSEAERGEAALRSCYEQALASDIGPLFRQLLARQYDEIIRGHDALRELRHIAAAA